MSDPLEIPHDPPPLAAAVCCEPAATCDRVLAQRDRYRAALEEARQALVVLPITGCRAAIKRIDAALSSEEETGG